MNAQELFAEFKEIYGYLGSNSLATPMGKVHIGLAAGLLGACVLSLLILLLIKFFKKPKSVLEIMREKIDKALIMHQNGHKDLASLYADLTAVVKFLVERRLKIKAALLTDAELFAQLEQQLEDQTFVAAVQDFVTRAQTIKFAKQGQMQDQVLQDVTMIKSALQELALLQKAK